MQDQQEPPSAITSGVWEALRHPPRNRPVARALASFSDIQEVIEVVNEAGEELKENKYDLLCPREGCGSLILKKGSAKFVESPSVELEPPTHASVAPLMPMIHPSERIHWWLVTPNPMAFENVGFSRPVESSQSTNGPKKKFLICAECDLGPLGWCVEGGRDFWLVCDRVGYRE